MSSQVAFAGSDHKGVIDRRFLSRDAELFFQQFRSERRGKSIGHVDHRGNPACDGCGRFGGEIGLVRQSGIAEVYVRVDGSGEQVLVVGQDQARAHRQADRGVDPFDDAFADQYVALDDRAFIYDFCVFYQDVFVHVRMRKIVNYIGLVCRYRVRFTAVEKNTSFELALRSMWYCARSSSR